MDEDQAEEIREVLDSNNADAPTRTVRAALDSVGQVTSAQSTATRQDTLQSIGSTAAERQTPCDTTTTESF